MGVDGRHDCSSPPLCRGRTRGKRGQQNQALGRSKGGFSCKINTIVDALGNPLRFLLTPGNAHDLRAALTLLENLDIQALLADKAFDADWFLELLEKLGIQAVIPPKSNRKIQRHYDKHLYKERNAIERFFNKIKHFRRIFSRFDKLDSSFLGFLYLAGTLIWLR
jgi:transposase